LNKSFTERLRGRMNSNFLSQELENTSKIWTVGALCLAVSDALQARFNPVNVQGEVSGFIRASSGHCYFTLKDESGQLKCAMFKRAASQLVVGLKDGDKIQATGQLGVYQGRGDLQLVVERVRTQGRGSLFEEFIKIKQKLQAQGLFDESRKRSLTPTPKAIGVVTSLDAAALRDVVITLKRRVPHIPVIVSGALVQGTQSAASLMQALKALFKLSQVEVILLVRGGGAMEDLWSFNDEGLAHVIASSPVPIVCGIGHETDFTIADFCADLRAATPTAAAELCATSQDTLSSELGSVQERFERALWHVLDTQSQALDHLQLRLGAPSAYALKQGARLDLLEQRLTPALRERRHQGAFEVEQWSQSLSRALLGCIQARAQALDHAQLRLNLLDPSLVLKRGYAWLSDEQGVPVTQARGLKKGQLIGATLADGELQLQVREEPVIK
jgi:exodeoxyribonuclease VII large subunit